MKQYCIRGHDTHAVGRVQRMCRECRRESDRKRYRTQHRAQYKRAWWHRVGFLRQLNERVDTAIKAWEVKFGSHK